MERKRINVFEPDLWAGKTGTEIWEIYRADLHSRFSNIFASERPRAVVRVKEDSALEARAVA